MPRVAPLDPATYVRHRTHRGDRVWAETNCYTDVVIELLHGLGHEPLAAMPFALTIGWDVDQWTFFKFPQADVELLYGIGFHELAPWRPLVSHIEDNVAAGRPVLVELDSYFLPDTAGTAYRLAHVKSTVAVNEIDAGARRLGYFHNQGYHELGGADFDDIFQTNGLVHDRMLPPYIEFVRAVPGAVALDGSARLDASLGLLRTHLRRLPPENPFHPFKIAFQRDQEWLLQAEGDAFHAYAFATLRQLGAGYELAGTYLDWLGEQGVDGLSEPRAALGEITTGAKALQFQLARAMARKRPLDLAPLDGLAARWDAAMGALVRDFG